MKGSPVRVRASASRISRCFVCAHRASLQADEHPANTPLDKIYRTGGRRFGSPISTAPDELAGGARSRARAFVPELVRFTHRISIQLPRTRSYATAAISSACSQVVSGSHSRKTTTGRGLNQLPRPASPPFPDDHHSVSLQRHREGRRRLAIPCKRKFMHGYGYALTAMSES